MHFTTKRSSLYSFSALLEEKYFSCFHSFTCKIKVNTTNQNVMILKVIKKIFFLYLIKLLIKIIKLKHAIFYIPGHLNLLSPVIVFEEQPLLPS